MNPTIEQLKEGKKNVEIKILDILTDFTRDYNLSSVSIEFNRSIIQEIRDEQGTLLSSINSLEINMKIGL